MPKGQVLGLVRDISRTCPGQTDRFFKDLKVGHRIVFSGHRALSSQQRFELQNKGQSTHFDDTIQVYIPYKYANMMTLYKLIKTAKFPTSTAKYCSFSSKPLHVATKWISTNKTLTT